VGTLYGRFVLGTANGTLPLVGPMVIACLPPMRPWGPELQWRTGLRWVSAAATVFALFSGLARLGFLPSTQIDVVNHEKAFLVVLGIAAAVAARDRLLVPASVAAAAFAFVSYPAATYVVAALVMLGTLVLVRWAPDGGQRVVLAVITMVVTVVAVLKIADLIRLTNTYFQLVGKQNNGNTREALYRAALERLHHPVFSSFFTGDITVVGNLSGKNTVVPVHNDYLSISLGGGLVAAGLLLALFLFLNGLALRTLRAEIDVWQRRTVVVLLGAVNAAAVSAFANPIFMNPGASAVCYALVAALLAACRLPDAEAPGAGRASTLTLADHPR
jgi:O-antigen ligase